MGLPCWLALAQGDTLQGTGSACAQGHDRATRGHRGVRWTPLGPQPCVLRCGGFPRKEVTNPPPWGWWARQGGTRGYLSLAPFRTQATYLTVGLCPCWAWTPRLQGREAVGLTSGTSGPDRGPDTENVREQTLRVNPGMKSQFCLSRARDLGGSTTWSLGFRVCVGGCDRQPAPRRWADKITRGPQRAPYTPRVLS